MKSGQRERNGSKPRGQGNAWDRKRAITLGDYPWCLGGSSWGPERVKENRSYLAALLAAVGRKGQVSVVSRSLVVFKHLSENQHLGDVMAVGASLGVSLVLAVF